MRYWLTTMLVGPVAAVAIAAGSTTAAVAAPKHVQHNVTHAARAASETSSEAGQEAVAQEAETDATQQAAACQKAGVDPNGDNVQFDGNSCSTTGAGNTAGGDQTQQGGGDQTQQ